MMLRIVKYVFLLWIAASWTACTEYTPKPRGYFRIEPPAAAYRDTSVCGLPFSFCLSDQAVVKKAGADSAQHWFYIAYPALKAHLYCGYLSGRRETLIDAYVEFLRMPDRLVNTEQTARTPAWSLTEENLYGELFCDSNNPASPMQFVIFGDNADSLAPVNAYLKQDVIELIKSFTWTN